jgi:hypothetical protein
MSASLPSSPDRILSRRDVIVLAMATALSLGIYLGSSALFYRIGFPLDDSWIHQTYARNLALRGEWSFLPGLPSAGSTAPLWTALLSIGFFLHLSPYIWTYFLGGLLLFGISLLCESFFRRTVPSYHPGIPWCGLLFVAEWHLAWAAFSGMETVLHIFLILWVVNLILTNSRSYLLAGIITGVSVWVRPDGVTLLGPLVFAVLLEKSSSSIKLQRLLRLVIGFGAFFLPYLLFNLIVSDTPMPNTFYAKQAEYASWQAIPFGERLVLFSLQFFLGASFVLIPGFILKVIAAVRERNWCVLLTVVWVLGYILLYLLRLPVYQHARYLMPALAVFMIIGLNGFLENLALSRAPRLRVAGSISLFALITFLFASGAYGVYTYGQDVAYIESQMVDTANWVSQHVPSDALIAAHDIGALGYFDHHKLVDLAGLISPDVVSFINDDTRLAAYLDAQNVHYLIAFPGWRPALTNRGTLINVVVSSYISRTGLGNMTVYRWNKP